jgi:hypothetical protein
VIVPSVARRRGAGPAGPIARPSASGDRRCRGLYSIRRSVVGWRPVSPHPLRAVALLPAALLAAGAASHARAGAPEAAAPLGIGTPGPVRQLLLDPVLADARAVTAPWVSVRLETVNSWSVPTRLRRGDRMVLARMDAQSDQLALAVRIPWSRVFGPGGFRERVATTFSWRLGVHWGGFEDGAIEGWHRLVGAFNFRRSRYPRDEIHLLLAEAGGATAFDLESATLAWGDLVAATQALLASGGASRVRGASPADPGWALAARFEIKAPAGSLARAGGSGGVDAGVSLLGSAELARWFVVHGMLSGRVVSPLASSISLQPRRFQGTAEVSAVLVLGGISLLVEDRLHSPLTEGGWTVVDGGRDDVFESSAGAALLRPHNQISGGIRCGPATLSLSEDFTLGSNPRSRQTWFYNQNAPDIVVALTLRRSFR